VALARLSARAGAACVVLLLTLSRAAVADAVQDRVEITEAIDQWVVVINHVRGIGGAELKVPQSEWPAAVVVRLHGFPELESFTATSKTAKLECALVRPEGQHPFQTCQLDDDRVDALRREPNYFEVELPRAIFPSDGHGIEIRWVDQWR
jgi:hypothetical protein